MKKTVQTVPALGPVLLAWFNRRWAQGWILSTPQAQKSDETNDIKPLSPLRIFYFIFFRTNGRKTKRQYAVATEPRCLPLENVSIRSRKLIELVPRDSHYLSQGPKPGKLGWGTPQTPALISAGTK
jgi:hypothetical protein